MQNKLLARALATMMAATTAVTTASVPMIVAPIVAMAETAKATITVKNVDAGATVTAYQLVKGVYASDKLTKYELTDLASNVTVGDKTVTLSDLVDAVKSGEGDSATWEPDNTDLLAAWTAAVAAKVKTSSATAYTTTWSSNDTTYTASAEPGLYLVLITKDNSTTTYSPILLAVNVTDANDVANNIKGEEVDVTNFFQNGSTIAYAKKVTNGFKKSIVKTETGGTTSDVKGIAAAVGETVSFKLDDMKLQYYSDKNTTPKYVITDSLEENCFGPISNLKVVVGNTTIYENGAFTGGNTNAFTLKAADGTTDFTNASTGYQITFSSDFLKAHAGEAVSVTYDSKLIATAGQNYAENVNHAQLVYSYIDPAASYKIADKTLTDNTYVYTFGIDTNIDKEDSTSDYIDYTLNKVSEKVGGAAFTETTDSVKTKVSPKAIKTADAQFTLYSDADCTAQAKYGDNTTVVPVATADANGHISFTGLKPGTYYLKETKAPTGYTLSTTVYTITIVAIIDDKTGAMSEYSITTSWTDGTAQNAVTKVTATTSETVSATGDIPYTVTIDNSTTPVEIVNTTLQQLPFTGGEGRYAIYIGSVALAALVVILLIVKRRRDEQEQ